MVVFSTNLKRLFKKKMNLIFMLILPLVFMLLVLGASQKSTTYKIGLVDSDATKYTKILDDKLADKGTIVKLTHDQIQDQLVNNKVDYVIEIDKGLTDNLIHGQAASVKGYSVKESNESTPIKLYVESFVDASQNIGRASQGDVEKFYQGIQYYQDGSFADQSKSMDNSSKHVDKTLQALGFLVMSMVFLITFATTLILEDKTSGTFFRMFTTPLTSRSYMMQNILSFMTLSLIQIVVVLFVMDKVFKLDFGSSIGTVFVMFVIFSLVCVALGVAISRMSKSLRHANTIISLVNVPMCMLGGCFWPRDIMPDVLQKIGNFVPTTWILKSAEKALNGQPLSSLGLELGVLAAFFLVFFLLSSVRKVDIAN